MFELQHNDVQGNRYVGQRFDRHQQVGHLGDSLDTADEHKRQDCGQGNTGIGRIKAERIL
ncbi:hypothetical protein D3C78_1718960 [compost metagenome]